MAIDERTLHGMQRSIRRRQALHSDEFRAVDGGQEADAGIDRTILDLPSVRGQLPEHYRARSAVAFGTSLLGAGAPRAVAQILQHRGSRRDSRDAAQLAIEHEARRLCVADGVVHGNRTRARAALSCRDKWNSSMAIPTAERDSPAPGLPLRMQ